MGDKGLVNRDGEVVMVSRSQTLIGVIAPYHREMIFCRVRRGHKLPKVGSQVFLSKTRGGWIASNKETS